MGKLRQCKPRRRRVGRVSIYLRRRRWWVYYRELGRPVRKSVADAMRLALEETLRTQEVLFEFQVQLRTSERTMPIEDASIEWPESESPYRTVAHLLLPRQEFELLRQQDAYKNLSFNVWHALAAHRPLGGINCVRRRAYVLSTSWRRQQVAVKLEVRPSSGGVC